MCVAAAAHQVKKLVTKVVSKENIYYRKLTDKPKDEKKDDDTASAESETDVSMATDDASALVTLDVETLGKGTRTTDETLP